MRPNLYKFISSVFLALICLFATTTQALAQETAISGTVASAEGPIPGANILIKGTNVGTSANENGEFTISSASPGGTLVVSAIGYQSQEIPLNNQTSFKVTLEEDVNALSEVVVTGYTTDNRRQTTGAVSTVKSKDLQAIPSGNVEQQLQGRVAGVTVITNGQPGTTSQVRVRGFGAFGGNAPLYVVDGVPVGSTDFLNPDDIESTTVLKDAAAASIYGARAANGVIIYTTKKGSKGAKKLSLTYDGMYGATSAGKGIDVLNPTEFADWTWRAIKNSGQEIGTEEGQFSHPQFGADPDGPVIPDYIMVGGESGVIGNIDLEAQREKYNVDPRRGAIYQVMKANKQGTDWYRAITRSAPLQRHSLGFRGAGDNSRYYIGLGAQNQAGILKNNDFMRYSFRVNSEFDVLKNLRIGENLQFTNRRVLGLMGGGGGQGVSAEENSLLTAFRMPSIIPIYDEFGGYGGTAAKGFNNPKNPVAERDGIGDNRSFDAKAFGNIYIEYEPIEGLTLRSSLGADYRNYYYTNYSRWQYENSENNSAFGFGEGSGYNFAWTMTNTANYKKVFGDHSLDVLLGQESLNTGKGRDNSGSGQNPFLWDPNYITLSNVESRVVNSSLYNGVNFMSFFARVNYAYQDKYIVTALVRRDGSSRFGPNSRWGNFPAFSAAWRVSAEPFMEGLPFIDDLKIRGGYGLMGNSNNVDPNNQFTLFSSNLGESVYDVNGTNSAVVEGFFRTRLGNVDAKWESSVTANIGLDGTFFNGKWDLILDVWQKNTRDLLFQVPVPQTLGYRAAAPSVNVGKMLNKGVDLQIINRGQFGGDWSYTVDLTASFLKNEIVSLIEGTDYLTNVNPDFRGIQPIRNQVGYSLSAFYGYQMDGLFQNQAEIDAAPVQPGVIKSSDESFNADVPSGMGRFKFRDISGPEGVPDGIIDPFDRTYLGSPVPKFTGGVTLNLKYKFLELEAYLYTSLGNKIWNQSRWFTDFYPSFSGAGISARVKDSWSPENPNATIPIFETASNFSTNSQANSFYVEDGSYLRFQNVTLGFNVPSDFLQRLKLEKLRIFASANNLFTITQYDGLDPAVGGNADTNFGIDVGNYPVTRGWTVGLNLGF